MGFHKVTAESGSGKRGPDLLVAPPRFSFPTLMLHIVFAKGFKTRDLGLCPVLGTSGRLWSGGCHQPNRMDGPDGSRVFRARKISQRRVLHPVRTELGEVTSGGLKPRLNCSKGLESNVLTRRSWV